MLFGIGRTPKRIEFTDNLEDDEKAIFIDRLSDENNVNQQTIELISEMQIVAVEELRLINNGIKHSGLVSGNLAKYSN